MALKNKKPTNQCLWRVGLGNLKLDQDLSPKSPIARPLRHTTCATGAWTTPRLATIQHITSTLPDFTIAVNRKGRHPCLQKPRAICTNLHTLFNSSENAITNPLQHSPTHRSRPSTVHPTFVRGIFASRRLPAERFRTPANVTKETLSPEVLGVMLPAVPRVTTEAWNQPSPD